MIGHFARMCKKPENGTMRRRGRPLARGGIRRINLIEQDDSQSESSNEMNDDNMVLHVSGAGNQPFVLKGKINKEPFSTMVDSGSPITIFTQADLSSEIGRNISKTSPKARTICGLQQQTIELIRVHHSRRTSGQEKNKERQNTQRRKNVLDKTRLVESTELPCGRSNKKL